jgi:hypothetical protein
MVTPPPPPLKIKGIKIRERQLLGNCILHSKTITQTMEVFLSESIGEDVGSMLGRREVLQIDDLVMNHLPAKMHIFLDMFCLLSLYWILTEFKCTLVVTPDHICMVELNVELTEEVM